MRRHPSRMAAALAALAATSALTLTTIDSAHAAPSTTRQTTAWRDGALQVDTKGLVSRSDIVLEKPSWQPHQSMPLGNGVLGAAVWAEDGFTAQLNRTDTFPDLKSAGKLIVPGLNPLMRAGNYRGRLQLHDAMLTQRGDGMSARTYVRADKDQFVLEVTGADPGERQTAKLRLWEGRTPTTYADDGVAALAETFTDEQSGSKTGAIAAMTAGARDVETSVVDGHTVRLSFRPYRDGSFRIVAGVPSYSGGDVGKASDDALVGALADRPAHAHLAWWHRFWAKAAPMRISSPDGTGEYLEALRAQQLYMTAASMRSAVPSAHGGVINMFSPWQDSVHWSADYWWHFNLRQPVYANFGADTAEFNEPYFRLYLDRLAKMRKWTREHWSEAEVGVCVPEYLRYDGTAGACDSSKEPSWLNRIITTGPEVAYNLWLQYRYTGDRTILEKGYPMMRGVVRFYLSILDEGADGYLHLRHVNALETQWDTSDPTPDLAAMWKLFPIVARLATDHGDDKLAKRLRDALPKIPPFRTVTRNGEQLIAWSGTDEEAHNTQNPDMQALFPWGLFDADSKLMQQTYSNRVFRQTREWSEDSLWAARLGLSRDVNRLLVQGTKSFQIFPNGFTSHNKNADPAAVNNYYSGWGAVATSTLQEALVQSYDGVIRVAAAWPSQWNVSGSVQIEGGHRVSTQVRGGVANLVGIQAARDDVLRIENPWPDHRVRVVDGDHGRGGPIVRPTSADVIELRVEKGHSYLLERTNQPYPSFAFQRVEGDQARMVKHLGERTFGVETSTPQIRSDLVTVDKPERLHALVRAREGVAYYVDRSYVITDLPEALAGAVLIRGANEDSTQTEPKDYLVLDLARPATVYVAFDLRGEGEWWPDWLEDLTRTDMTIQTSDVPLAVFKKTVRSGRVDLGPNSGMAGKGNSSYITLVTDARS